MNKDERKEYNKTYYAKNRESILDKHYKKKDSCELCGRIVSHANLNKHYMSALCARRVNKKQELELRKRQLNAEQ
jgi:hypothetical protein